MSLSDNINQGVGAVTKSRSLPIITAMLCGITFSLIFMYFQFCAGNSHYRKAQKLFEESNFNGAISEIDAYLQEEPDAVDGLVLLGHSHAAASRITRGKGRMEHVCAGLEAYIKSLELFFNNNISSRMHALASENGMDVDKGEIYGGCGRGGGEFYERRGIPAGGDDLGGEIDGGDEEYGDDESGSDEEYDGEYE